MGSAMQNVMEGGCHCGRVRFRVTADLDGVTICNCSICTKKGIWHLIVPPKRFDLLQGASDLATYQFNTKVAKHHFCKVCGVHPFYVPRSDPDKIDVNARCLAVSTRRHHAEAFDGRTGRRRCGARARRDRIFARLIRI